MAILSTKETLGFLELGLKMEVKVNESTVFEISSYGIRISNAIVDWDTGEVLVESNEWVTPTSELLSRFKDTVKNSPVSNGETGSWALYLSDLKVVVMLMGEWIKRYILSV